MGRILIVDDDLDLAKITEVYLNHSGYETDTAYTSSDAIHLINDNQYDLILLDVMLPDKPGDVLCEEIREHHSCPVIFTSCLDDSGTIVKALRGGGDDYMVKPIKYDELLARIEANIRRWQSQNPMDEACDNRHMLHFNHFDVDTLRHRLLVGGETVELSSIEYSLLRHFLSNPGRLLMYGELYNQVWKQDSFGDVRTVMVHISNLRKKIDPEKYGIIQTVRGAGYIFGDV